jgi:hypothetical protein
MKVYKKFSKCLCAFDFDNVMTPVKIQRVVFTLQVIGSLYRGKYERRWRVLTHKFESLRSLIRDIRIFLDLVNVDERSFKITLQQLE